MADDVTTRTTCPYCGVGCGVVATRAPDGRVSVAGDPEHPANAGRLCSKGLALAETLSLDDRLLAPEIAGKPASWEAALDLVAEKFTTAIAAHGPESVAFYVSGQLLTEDYYVANKLMKGFIGTANIDTNSRLCMASAVAGHRRAFGEDTVPATYADLEEADLIVFVGSNFAWCHPVLFQRVMAARERKGTRLIVIDPRRTTTAENADLHLSLAPDSDVPLFLGLLNHLERNGGRDAAYVAAHVEGMEEALAEAAPFDIDRVGQATGLRHSEIAAFYEAFAGTPKVVTVFSQGSNQSVVGTDKANAILNCHLFTGRIGKPGSAPFSITGQPNAMGGREVGGLANMLAAHMDIEDAAARARVQRFWSSPRMAEKPGLKAVDLFEAVRAGRIKALWIMATNPVDSLPQAERVREALEKCPFVVISDCNRNTDTVPYADVLLPASTWGEKDGTVTNSERRISRQRAFLPAPGEARPDWWHMAQVARRMGFAGFDYAGPAAIFSEHAALSAFENNGTRAFDIGACASLSEAEYKAMTPFMWPRPAGAAPAETRLYANGGFYRPGGRAKAVAVAAPAETKPRTPGFALWLNTGRIRDQWHTMTRTGKTGRLLGHYSEPFCELHPKDAEAAGILPARLMRVETAHGSVLVRAEVSERARPGSVFLPMHWTDQFSARARADALVDAMTDPVSGQPGSKRTPCAIRPFAAGWYGFAVSVNKPAATGADYWALAPLPGGWRVELAGAEAPADWQAFAQALFGLEGAVDWLSYAEVKRGVIRLAAFAGSRLMGALFVAREPVALSRDFLGDALAEAHDGSERYRVLAGQGGAARPDRGAIVCACFQVGVKEIEAAIAQGAASVAAVGLALKAGTNCGSCKTDIRKLIEAGANPPPSTSRQSERLPALT